MTAQRISLRAIGTSTAAALLALVGFQSAVSADTVVANAGNGGSITIEIPASSEISTGNSPEYQQAAYEISPADSTAVNANAPQPSNADASAWAAQTSHAHN